jgi:hypothetical protein
MSDAYAIKIPAKYSIMEYLNQDRFWITKNGFVEIKDMASDHRALARRWMEGHATALIGLFESAQHEAIVTGYSEDDIGSLIWLMSQNPKEWVTNTPLYKALSGR